MLKPITFSRLKDQGLPTNSLLPEVAATPARAVQEVTKRAVILGVFVAIAAHPKSVGHFSGLLSEMNMTEALSAEEKKILKQGKLSAQQEIRPLLEPGKFICPQLVPRHRSANERRHRRS